MGYLVDFKNKRRMNAGTNASYNVNLLTESNQSNDQQNPVFNYRKNTNVLDQIKPGSNAQAQGSNSNVENSGLENYALTNSQYE